VMIPETLVAAEKKIVRGFQNYHMDSHGWSDIWYHFLIFASGNVYLGRPVGAYGAHTLNANHTTGFCFVMGPGDMPTADMIESFHTLRNRHGVKRYRGHRQVPGNYTQCPGDDLIEILRMPVGY
jgi:N-acetylmuramoyl-L-alanine amidase